MTAINDELVKIIYNTEYDILKFLKRFTIFRLAFIE